MSQSKISAVPAIFLVLAAVTVIVVISMIFGAGLMTAVFTIHESNEPVTYPVNGNSVVGALTVTQQNGYQKLALIGRQIQMRHAVLGVKVNQYEFDNFKCKNTNSGDGWVDISCTLLIAGNVEVEGITVTDTDTWKTELIPVGSSDR